MKDYWARTLLFSILGLGIGYLIGRMTPQVIEQERIEKRVIKKDMHDQNEWVEDAKDIGNEQEEVDAIIRDVEKSSFEGDTTIYIEGGRIHIKRSADEMEVQVELEG